MVVAFGIPICLLRLINLKRLIKEQPVSPPETAPLVHGNTKINLNNLGWCPLQVQERRAKIKVTLLFKIIHNLSIVDKSDLISTNSLCRPFSFFVPRSEKDVQCSPTFLLPFLYLTLELTASYHQKLTELVEL